MKNQWKKRNNLIKTNKIKIMNNKYNLTNKKKKILMQIMRFNLLN